MTTEKTFNTFSFFINQFISTVVSVLKIIVRSKFGLSLPQSETQKCIVLANGPSLINSMKGHPRLFQQHPLICVNTFALTTEFTTLKPQYYVMLDPFFWEADNSTADSTFRALAETTSWNLQLLVPQTAMHEKVFAELKSKNKHIRVIPFNYTVFKGFQKTSHWLFRKNLAMPQSPNVTIAALFLGINLGFREIMLVGADHTWHENLYMSPDNILHTKVSHFYDNDTEVKFVPLKKGAKFNFETETAHEFFDKWSKTFYGYKLIKDYAQYRNVKIFNASEVSFIDSFERIKLS